MKTITFYILLFITASAFAQNDTLSVKILDSELTVIKSSIDDLKKTNIGLNTELSILNSRLNAAFDSIKNLNMQLQNNSKVLAETADNLGVEINANDEIAKQRLEEVHDSLSNKTLYGIIGLLTAVLFSSILYWYLRKRQKSEKSDIIGQLNETRSSLEENIVKELTKQTELLDKQWAQIEEKINKKSPVAPAQEIDHSLPLKVADEITIIERNISFMDKNVKGIKQLLRSVQKLKDNLNANGYEIPDLIGTQYHPGMKIILVNSVIDDNIEKDKEIITKVIKPQVNYMDRIIQSAQVENSKNL